jgi:hypothetical protein
MLSNSRRIRLSPDSRCPGRDFNPGHPEYEAGLLTTRPQRTVHDKSNVHKNIRQALSQSHTAPPPPPHFTRSCADGVTNDIWPLWL